jgi:ParB/RepB/Spo0J family partition protein
MSTTAEKAAPKLSGKTATTAQDGHKKEGDASTSPVGVSQAPQPNPWQIVVVPVEHVGPSPYQPRVAFDAADMEELVASVKERGVQQPVIVRTARPAASPDAKSQLNGKSALNGAAEANGKSVSNDKPAPNGKPAPSPFLYELVAGERRLRACKQAKRKYIPAIVRDDLSDVQAAELALLENVQRSNLTCIEEARGYKRLMLEFRLKEERLSKKVGKSVSTIRELMKLLQLPEAVQTLLWQKKLTAAHGYTLLPLAPFERICLSVAERIVQDKLSATSLAQNILPNAKTMLKQSLIVELDYKTKFHWQEECAKCPFKAYIRAGYQSFCLRPEEWLKKQSVALERIEQGQQSQEENAASVMEQARKDNSALVDVEHLTPGSYKDLSFGEPPSGCTANCPCYREMHDPHDPTKKRAVCLDPNRYKGLVQAERESEENARRVRFHAMWEAAKEKLGAEVESGELRRIAVLVAVPILRSMYDELGYVESWRQGVEQIAEELGISVMEEFLNADTESDACAALDQAMRNGCAPQKVLLLCVCLMLADEARTAIRFIRETPGLDFVNGAAGEQQGELTTGEESDGEAPVMGEVFAHAGFSDEERPHPANLEMTVEADEVA